MSSHDDLLGLHVVAIDEAEDIYASDSWQLTVGSWQLLGEELVTEGVEDLERAFAVDNELSVADEGKVVIVVLVVFIHPEHQLETALVVRDLAVEGVARSGEEVNVGAGEVIDEVEII